MLVIGLTGGIGTGKSEVARILQEFGAEVIDADRLGHGLYQPHTEAWRQVVSGFGEGILTATGEVDRKKLGELVFRDPRALERLNAIMHPGMYEAIGTRLQELRAKGCRVVVVDAAVLMEAGWTSLVDEVWMTVAPEETVVQRIKGRSQLSEEATRDRIRAQLPQEERRKHADVVIENAGDLASLRRQVAELWNRRVHLRLEGYEPQ